MKSAVAIRHVAFEDLGTFAPVLASAGYEVRYVKASDGLHGDRAEHADLLIVLGGPVSAYEEDAYPFLRDELRLLEKRLAAARPTLGICLGAQLLARSLGARVFPGHAKEIGWAPVSLTPEGSSSCLRHIGAETSVLHWHGDTFDLPDGASRLARSAVYDNQAFAVGPAVLAVQFHLEVMPRRLEHWFVGHSCEIAATPGVDVSRLRHDSLVHGPALERAAAKVLADWLNHGHP